MCGVIYFKGDSEIHKELLINILRESQVRGLHAFGVALRKKAEEQFWVERFFNLKMAIEFIECHSFYEAIGHCRYDTSGDWRNIDNNQPVVVGRNILAFNGVVRMSTRDEYQEEFQREYSTENDGEIPLRMFVEGEQEAAMSLLDEKRVSFSGVVHTNGRTMAVRNERRPLWQARMGDSQWIVSTADIWQRAYHELEQKGAFLIRELFPMEVVWL